MNSFNNNNELNKNIYIEKKFENKYALSLKYPLLFDITANQKYNIDHKYLIKNAYEYYKQLYNINKNLDLLIKSNDFKKDTELLYIAINNSNTYELKNIEEYYSKKNNDIFENIIYDLNKLGDISNNIVNLIHNIDTHFSEVNNLHLMIKESEKYIKKYY